MTMNTTGMTHATGAAQPAGARSYTSFQAHRRIASGPLSINALAVKNALVRRAEEPVLVFDDETGRTVEVDTRGSDEDVLARLSHPQAPAEPRGRGRPKLGVVAREVTLLPRHWDWLSAQPGGASVALRKLVEEARRASSSKDRARQSQERAYHFMLAIGGDLPGFEEAIRALFAGDEAAVRKAIAKWPKDVREHALHLGFGEETLPH